MNVYVLHYNHKHGDDISVYKTLHFAQESADEIMTNRVKESWDVGDRDLFSSFTDFDERISYFHDIEREKAYGEAIEIMIREIQPTKLYDGRG